ncbi:MAG TPA: hypothetical protein VKZ72_03870 [Acidimicrobiales bacterium]|jgi:hypothetical protein|nr:hypothetical protein [Acidimicrobiales bacterium]
MTTRTPPAARPATWRVDDREGAFDEYVALHVTAMGRVVEHGLAVAAAAASLQAGAHELADRHEVAGQVVAVVAQVTEKALADLHDEFHRVVLHVLRLGRARLGLC